MPYTKNISIRDFYKKYVEIAKHRNRQYLKYTEYSKLLKDFNLRLRDKIVYNSECAVLPYKLGELFIRKFELNYKLENRWKWAVDYGHFKKTGEIKYFGETYGYRWRWDKKKCIVKGKKYYYFSPCRKAKRLIADALNNKQLDYYK